jgi:uncharacterized protein YndB with AHSA1/START domain
VQRIEITHDFRLPVGRVYAHLAEHENLGPVFGVSVRRLRDGDTSRNGAGSVRELRLGPLPAFEETVTAAVPDELIEYRITRGSPLNHHRGRMQFTPRGDGSRLHYVIELGLPVPLADRVLKAVLERNVRCGLAGVDARA